MTETLAMLPPQNIEAEQMVLGAVLLDNDALTVADNELRPDDFYKSAHRSIFSAMLTMRERGEAIDLLTLAEMMRHGEALEKVGGAFYLSTLAALVPTAANIKHHARIVARAAQLRAIDNACSEIKTGIYTGADPDALITSLVARLTSARRYKTDSILMANDLMHVGFTEIGRRYDCAQSGRIPGIPTGHRDLDRKLFGFSPQLYVLSGAPSMGKSALADGFVRSAAAHFQAEWESQLPDVRPERPGHAGEISLEMSPQMIALRNLSSRSRVPLSRLLAGTLHPQDFGKLHAAASEHSALPICYEFSSYSDREMERTIDHMVQTLGVMFLVFDYLQQGYVEDHKGTREQEVSRLSRLLKRKAKEHNIPIVVLSSLNRGIANRPEKRPNMSDLRESGNIEFDGDVIMFVYRVEVYNKCACPPKNQGGVCICGRRGKAEIIIEKGKMEGTGTVELEWETNYTTFVDKA